MPPKVVFRIFCDAGQVPWYAVPATCTVTSPESVSTSSGSNTNSYVVPPSRLTAGVTWCVVSS
jgi:hypothetical protein